jgi:predicted dehydrogenase
MSIDVAVIGCGYWGPKLIRNFDAVERLNLVAVCDLMEERLAEVREGYPHVETTTDLESVIESPSIDAVAIATPISTHFPMAKRALLAGKHVFIEKPLAMQSRDARELLYLAGETGRVLMVDDIFLYSGKVVAIRELVDRGEIGDLYYIDAVRVNLNELRGMGRSTGFYPDASVLWDLAPHDVAIMVSLADSDPVRVCATGASPVDYCPDGWPSMAWGSVTFESGAVGHFHVNWLAPEQRKRTVIVGSRKMIVYDDLDAERPVVLYDKGVDVFPMPTPGEPSLVRYREGEARAVPWDASEPLRVGVEHFRDCILEGREPRSGAVFALRVVSILEAAERSISNDGEPVEIPALSAVSR